MKTLKYLILSIFLLSQSCIINEPFDDTQLNQNYWNVFYESLNQVAFDHLAIGSSGFYGNSKTRNYTYQSDILDTVDHKRMYFVHKHDGYRILSSSYDSTYIKTEDVRNKIVWSIENNGVIFKGEKYNVRNELLSYEIYEFEFKSFAIDQFINESQYVGFICRISKKHKFNLLDELVETLKYTYFDDGTYEISHYNSLGEKIQVELIK